HPLVTNRCPTAAPLQQPRDRVFGARCRERRTGGAGAEREPAATKCEGAEDRVCPGDRRRAIAGHRKPGVGRADGGTIGDHWTGRGRGRPFPPRRRNPAMYRRILVPMDGSDSADAALPWAATLPCE